MKKTSTVLVLVIAVAVNLSNGNTIKTASPLSASFSGSSSSSSAFAHSSSSSYTFNGAISPEDLEKFKASAGAGAAAFAGAGAGAHSGAGASSLAGAGVGANVGALSGSNAGSSALAGSISGTQAGSGGISGGNSENSGNSYAGSDAIGTSGSGVSSGCSGSSKGCGGSQNAILVGGSAAPTNTYKIINTNTYNTGYSGGSKGTNYAVAGQYVEGKTEGSKAGGCSACKGPFPGPNGSIHDYKLASSVPTRAPVAAAIAPSIHHSGTAGSAASASIPVNKPPTHILPPASSEPIHHGTSSGSGHVSPNLIAIFPGPSGSIYDSKPAGVGANAGAISGASAGAFGGADSGSYGNSASYSNPPPSAGCTYTPGSTNKNCGSSNAGSSSGALPFPALPSSIHASKPASATGYGVSAGVSQSASGSVTNIPSSHPVVGPTCSYTPGSPNKKCGGAASSSAAGQGAAGVISILPGPSGSIYDSKPAGSVSGHGSAAGAAAGAGAASFANSGLVQNIPVPSPIAKPTCSYTPGSPNYCGGTVSDNAQKLTPGSSSSILPVLPGPSGSIYSSKPASSLSSQSNSGSVAYSGSVVETGSSAGAGSYNVFGTSSNVPSSHPVVGPVCSYSPGSPNKCGNAGLSGAGAVASANAAAQAGSNLHAPSIHPEVPTSLGTYYINKGTHSAEDGSAIHFTGQIPCADGSCGSEYPSQGSSIHDEAHKSGGIVFDNSDGKYNVLPVTSKPAHKNAEQGGYAISTDEAENTGVLIGPGTGHLPIESDSKPFGTQGAFGGSAAFIKSSQKDDKPFGTQGAFSSANFAKGSANAQSSGSQVIDNRPCAAGDCSSSSFGNKNEFVTGDVVIQKVDGTLVSPIDDGSYKPGCSTGGCGSGQGFGSGSSSYTGGQVTIKEKDTSKNPVKLECQGSSCGDTEVYIIEDKPSNYGSQGGYSGSGCSSGSCKESGLGSSSASSTGFATGQVLVQKGDSTTYDLTNEGSGENTFGGSYSGSNAGSYSGNQFSSGCSSGGCGGPALGLSGSFGFSSGGGLLNKLFGPGGLSGNLNKLASGASFAGSGAHANSGSFASASSGSFASASAHAGSFAHSFR